MKVVFRTAFLLVVAALGMSASSDALAQSSIIDTSSSLPAGTRCMVVRDVNADQTSDQWTYIYTDGIVEVASMPTSRGGGVIIGHVKSTLANGWDLGDLTRTSVPVGMENLRLGFVDSEGEFARLEWVGENVSLIYNSFE